MEKKMTPLNSESGFATLEALPLVIVFMVFIAYMIGMYGVTHTAILNSIGARNYAFEITRFRADLTYLRGNLKDNGDDLPDSATLSYKKVGARSFAIVGEDSPSGSDFPATARRIAMGLDSSQEEFDRQPDSVHNEGIYTIKGDQRNDKVGVRDVWIMTRYGICLDAQCADR